MTGLAEYEAWKAKQQQASVGAAGVVIGAQEQSPDQLAGDLNLASEFGKVTGNPVPPAPMVGEYRSVFQAAIEKKRAETILSSSPRLTEWLRNPENAGIARDDLEGLSWWETTFGATVNAGKRGLLRAGPQAKNQYFANVYAERAQDANRSFGDILHDERTPILNAEGKEVDRAWAGPSDLLGAGYRFAASRLTNLWGQTAEENALQYQQQAGQIAQRIAQIPMSPGGEAGKKRFMEASKAEGWQAQLSALASAFGEAPGEMTSFLLQTAAESLPTMAAAAGVGAATRNPSAAAAVLGGSSFASEYGSSPVEFFKEKGIDVSTPEGAMSAIRNPDLMRDAEQRGVTRGVIIGALDGLSGGIAGTKLAESAVGNMVLQSITQAVLGAGGEAGGQLASGQQFNIAEVVLEGLAEFVSAPVEVGGMAVSRVREIQARAADAEARVGLFQELAGQASASKLRARMPDRFRQFVEQATANGPVENVFVPASEFVQYFQSVGVDPETLISELDGVTMDDLDAALAGGGDLKIPTATYAAKIAGSEHDAFLMENMRFDPMDMTAREAADFNARVDEVMQEMWAEAEDIRLEDEKWRAVEGKIYDDMVSRLRIAGRSTEVATTEAMIYPAFYRVMAERSGLSTEEFLERYPLPQVQGAIPQGMQFRDVDELNRTLAELRARTAPKGPKTPLLDFIARRGGIDDVGGELKARNADGQRKPSQGRLARRLTEDGKPMPMTAAERASGNRFGWDDTAQAAVEAGFFDDNPVAIEWKLAQEQGDRVAPDMIPMLIEAIDRELAGQPAVADQSAENDAALDEMDRYLSEIGVSLDDSDDAIRAALEAAQAEDGRMYAQGPRGLIQIGADGQSVIRLFETANLSTMLHESGHFFLTVMQDLAAKGEGQSVADYEAIKGWWRENAAAVAADGNRAMPDAKLTAEDVQRAIDTGSTGDVMKDAAVDVGMQEQWARAFEAYLMEGKAPNVELRSAFEKFRAWLVSIYQRVAGLNVQISDDIRQVFDRMLATDAEIAKAKQAAGEGGPVFASAEEMGLTQEEYDRFLKLRGQAEDEAKARLMREIMEPIKREREKWFRDEKAKVQAEVERNVNAMPVFRALEWMGNRRWLGEGQPEALPDIRLSRKALVERYGEGVLKTLRRGKQTVYAVEGGIDPDDAAGWFGFGSGDELVKALERAPNRAEAIKAETDRVMNERHGDALNDGEIEQIALDAVHTDRRGEWIAAELKAVAEVAGVDIRLTAKDARASARQTVARMRVRDAVAANRFLAAERRAAEEAARLGAMLAREGVWMQNARRRIASKARDALDGGSVDAVARQIEQANASTLNRNETVQKLIDAKRRQLMNHALYMEARAVADEVGKAERFVQKLNKASTREKIAGAGRRENAQTDYLAALDDILDRYDFRKMSGRAEQRRGALAAFVDAMKAAGRENELSIPEAVLRDAGRKPYKTISVEELRGVVDSLKNIEHIALRWNDLIDAVNKRKLDEVVSDITAAFDANMPKRPPGRVATAGEGLRNAGRQFLDLVLNAGTILREIDGFKDMGAAYRNLKAPIDQAMDRLIVRKEKAAADLEALYAVYSKEDRRRMAVREHIPALGYALSKWERIAVALNTGNEGNMQRLTDPKVRGSLTPAQVKAVLATLDARDADFIQSVWDYVGSFKADIAARERRATGVEPAWVEAAPVDIAGKTLKGGYYPLKYDPRLSTLARDDEAQLLSEALQAGRFGKAQTKRGHLEARAQSSGRDVELDMSVLHRHVNQVIYDLELSEPVANSWKVLQSGEVRQAFMDAGRQADFDALETWLLDVGTGQLAAGDWINANARRFKSNFTAAKLAFNFGTVAAQITGLSQTMVVVGKRDFVRGLQASARLGVADEIAMKSSFMASRRTTFNKDVYDYYADPKLGPYASRWGDIKKEWIGPASFWLMTKVQWTLVDIPTWLSGYHQGLRKYGNDEAKAIAHADALVKRAQASGLFSDRSAIERGSVSRTTRQNDVIRLFTTLGSYMFAKFNVAYERSAVAGRTIKQEGVSLKSAQEAASWALDVAFLFTVEAVVMAALKGKLPDDEDDDDEGWAKFLAKETSLSVLGTIPFVRDVASFTQGFEGGGAYGGIVSEVGKPFQEIGQGKADKGLVKSIINGTGLATGLPSTQINRAVDAGWRAAEGEDVSVLEYFLGKRGK